MAENTSLVHTSYDPSSVALVGTFKNKFVQPVRVFEEDGETYVVVCLTANGNEALREVCHTADQKEVWRFPNFEFAVRKDSLLVSYAVLISIKVMHGSIVHLCVEHVSYAQAIHLVHECLLGQGMPPRWGVRSPAISPYIQAWILSLSSYVFHQGLLQQRTLLHHQSSQQVVMCHLKPVMVVGLLMLVGGGPHGIQGGSQGVY